jgi:hypothetical protein
VGCDLGETYGVWTRKTVRLRRAQPAARGRYLRKSRGTLEEEQGATGSKRLLLQVSRVSRYETCKCIRRMGWQLCAGYLVPRRFGVAIADVKNIIRIEYYLLSIELSSRPVW